MIGRPLFAYLRFAECVLGISFIPLKAPTYKNLKTQESSRDNTFVSELRTVLTFESTLLMSGLEAPAPSMDSYRTSVMLALISDEFIILLSSKIIVPTSPTYGTKNS